MIRKKEKVQRSVARVVVAAAAVVASIANGLNLVAMQMVTSLSFAFSSVCA